jgi:hypothetical protein
LSQVAPRSNDCPAMAGLGLLEIEQSGAAVPESTILFQRTDDQHCHEDGRSDINLTVGRQQIRRRKCKTTRRGGKTYVLRRLAQEFPSLLIVVHEQIRPGLSSSITVLGEQTLRCVANFQSQWFYFR